MPGYATIRLSPQTLGAVLASLSDTPGGEARFMHACLVYNYTGEDVYFVRGNYKNKPGLHDFDDHLFTAAQLDEMFDWTSTDGMMRKNARKPNGEWFAVFAKGSHLLDTLYDEDGQVIMRRTRGDLQAFLKKSGGRYLTCMVLPYGTDSKISVRKYKGEFNGEQAERAIGSGAQQDGKQADHAAGAGVPEQAA
jgi:hypothetical protein